jgi:hypothetical protein
MFRSVLVWVLTVACLVPLPVTGAGQCPCRFAKPLRHQQPPTAPQPVTPTCKCCREARAQDATTQPVGEPRSQPEPADGPCDHNFKADAVPGVGAGDRSDAAQEGGDVNPSVVGGPDVRSNSVNAARGGTVGPAPSAHSGTHLIRFAHAFRC